MEASRRPAAIRQRIAELYERYPLDKYIWIEPRMDTASPLPEHFDLAVYVRTIQTDLKANYIYPLKTRWDSGARQSVPDPEGGFALGKPALMGLAADAGIKWPLEGNGRIDDGSNPDLIEWRATGTILTLSGMSPISATKRIDLAIAREQDEMRFTAKPPREIYIGGKAIRWDDLSGDERENYIAAKVRENDLQRRSNLTEMAESKAQLRVIRSVLGIPSKFDLETLQKKSFATLRIIFAPNPTSPSERQAVLDGMMRMFLPAFPGAESARPPAAPLIGTIESPRRLVSPSETFPAVEEAGEIDDAGDFDPVGPGEIPPPASEPAPTAALAPPAKAPLDPDFLQAVGAQKRELCNLLGGERGCEEYYHILGAHGVRHANEVADRAAKKSIFRVLASRIKEIQAAEKKPAAELELKGEPDPLADFMAARRRSLLRMSMERIQEELDDLLESYDKHDPLEIFPRMAAAKSKENLADLVLEVTRHNLEETAGVRERHNARRGGVR